MQINNQEMNVIKSTSSGYDKIVDDNHDRFNVITKSKGYEI